MTKTYAVFPGLEALFVASKNRRWLSNPTVLNTLEEVSNHLSEITETKEDLAQFLTNTARPHRADMDRMFVSHTAMQVGIARAAFEGVEIDGIAGCSIGDLARMAVSGSLTLRETIDLVWFCANQRHLSPKGRMANVRPVDGRFTDAQLDWLFATKLPVSLWSDRHAAIAGTVEETDAIMGDAKKEGLKVRHIYDYPFHSMIMAPMAGKIAGHADRWPVREPRLPVFSSVELRHIHLPPELRKEALAGACEPVHWKKSVDMLMKDHGVGRLINIGPTDTLTSWIDSSEDHRGLEVIEAWDIVSGSRSAK